MEPKIKNIPIDDLKYLYDFYNKKNYPWLYLTKEGTLIKNSMGSPNVPKNLSERLLYVGSIPAIDGYTRPLSLLNDPKQGIYGYEQTFLKDYKSLDDIISKLSKENKFTMSLKDKKNMCLKLLETLKKINQYYYIGDISLQNLMLGKNDIQIIDWENGTPVNKRYEILSLYNIEELDNVGQLDAFKMFLACISVLYEYDIQIACAMESLGDIEGIFKYAKLNREILEYMKDFIYEVNTKSGRIPYFDEYLKHIKNVKVSEKKRVRQRHIYRLYF